MSIVFQHVDWEESFRKEQKKDDRLKYCLGQVQMIDQVHHPAMGVAWDAGDNPIVRESLEVVQRVQQRLYNRPA